MSKILHLKKKCKKENESIRKIKNLDFISMKNFCFCIIQLVLQEIGVIDTGFCVSGCHACIRIGVSKQWNMNAAHTHTMHTGRALTSFGCIKCSNPQLWMESVICNRYHRCASPMHWIYNHSLVFGFFFFFLPLLHIIRLLKCGQFMIVSLVKMQVISSLLACTACAYMLMTSKANHNIQLFTLENQEFIDSIVYIFIWTKRSWNTYISRLSSILRMAQEPCL